MEKLACSSPFATIAASLEMLEHHLPLAGKVTVTAKVCIRRATYLYCHGNRKDSNFPFSTIAADHCKGSNLQFSTLTAAHFPLKSLLTIRHFPNFQKLFGYFESPGRCSFSTLPEKLACRPQFATIAEKLAISYLLPKSPKSTRRSDIFSFPTSTEKLCVPLAIRHHRHCSRKA